MKLSQSLLIVLVPMIASCFGSTDSFWKEAASLSCQKLQDCNKAQFESAYSSMGDCVDTVTENGIDVTSTCEYDAEQGRECIKVTRKYKDICDLNAAEWGEVSRACEDTHYSCGAGVGLGFDPATGEMYMSSIESPAP